MMAKKGAPLGNKNATGSHSSKYLGARTPTVGGVLFGFRNLTPAGQRLMDKGIAKFPEVPRVTAATPAGFKAFTGKDAYKPRK